ncbi:MAG: hypothetical protein NVSMB45_10200 [Ginsengibacter sp.]
MLTRWKKKSAKKIGDPRLIKELLGGYSKTRFNIKFILAVTAVALCCFALATLVNPEGSQNIKRNGVDVMIALDVSNSMLADDIKPSRLERAKQIVSRLIDKLGNNKVGIVIFAGKAYLQMPLSIDHSAAKMYLSSASPEDVGTQGTVFSDALKMCYTAFNAKEKKYRSIILITDGEDHDEDAIKVTKELADQGVIVNTIGIGSPQGAMIRDKQTGETKKDENGNVVVSRLNEEELKQIAASGNGIYQWFNNADEIVSNLNQRLSTMQQSTVIDSSFTSYKHYFWYFLLLAFILLTAEFFLRDSKVNPYFASFIIIMFLGIGNSVFGQSVNKKIIQGNDAYRAGNFQKAIDVYSMAQQDAPTNAIASYNEGNALFKTDKQDEALNAYDNAIKNSTDLGTRSKAYYNKGVVLQKGKKLPECIEAYKYALRINPADEDARQNLERALQEQKSKDKSENQDKKDKSPQNPQSQKNQQQQPQPQPSKISQQDAEEKLKSLMDHEKNLQDKLKKVRNPGPERPAKDW